MPRCISWRCCSTFLYGTRSTCCIFDDDPSTLHNPKSHARVDACRIVWLGVCPVAVPRHVRDASRRRIGRDVDRVDFLLRPHFAVRTGPSGKRRTQPSPDTALRVLPVGIGTLHHVPLRPRRRHRPTGQAFAGLRTGTVQDQRRSRHECRPRSTLQHPFVR